jgi:predicted nucleic acid-binding protein
MRIVDAFDGIQDLYIDTAPFIYFVEQYPVYADKMRRVFQYVHNGSLFAVTSVITLTETLPEPIREKDAALETNYHELFLNTYNLRLISVSAGIASRAAHLRAQYNLKTPDALQIAAAVVSGCEAFLTNDLTIKRVQEISVLVLDELELS